MYYFIIIFSLIFNNQLNLVIAHDSRMPPPLPPLDGFVWEESSKKNKIKKKKIATPLRVPLELTYNSKEKIKKINSNKYVFQVNETHFFVMEKVDSVAKRKMWSEFANRNYRQTIVEKGTIEASDTFINYVNLSNKYPTLETWVVYSTRTPNMEDVEQLLKNVEMAFVLVTNSEVPFVQHYGIFRNVHITYEGVRHTNMSVILHAFAATVIKKIDKDNIGLSKTSKSYMINIPTAFMQQVLMKSLPKEAYEAHMFCKEPHCIKGWLEVSQDSFPRIVLRNYDGKQVLFKINTSQEKEQFEWFFHITSRGDGSSHTFHHSYFIVRLDLLAAAFKGTMHKKKIG